MAHSRRDFLKGSISLLTLALAGPQLGIQPIFAAPTDAASSANSRILVVVQLDGGNDGLNTVVPYTDKAYYDARPSLAIPEASVLKLNDKLGFHPAMTKFKGLFDEGRLAVVQNVGYPTPDLSHFRSRVIYNRADPTTQESFEQLGWLGKYADLKLATTDNPLSVVNFGTSVPKSLVAEKVIPASILSFPLFQFATDPKYPGDRLNQTNAIKKASAAKSKEADFKFVGDTGLDAISSADMLQSGIAKYTEAVTYPNSRLGQQMKMTAQVIAADLGAEVFQVFTSGFDTHSQQRQEHQELLTDLSDSFEAFYRDMVRLGKADRVLVLAFSEFGRRVRENGSQGTDHGTAGPMFVLGNAVRGGIYGKPSNLLDLDGTSNLKFDIDFRSVYHTVITDWLQTDAREVLGNQFENLGFLNR
jgi:uncharacterized protein (DUF1501 family)